MKVYVMVGVAGSGKSTFAKSLEKQLIEDGKSVKIFSSDECRMKMFGSLEEGNREGNNAIVFKRLNDYLMMTVKQGGYDSLIYDATNISRKRRRGLYQNIKQWNNEAKVEIIYLSVPLSTLLQRNRQRESEDFVPETKVISMYTNLQVPRASVDCDSFKVNGIQMFSELKEYNPEISIAYEIYKSGINNMQDELHRLFEGHECAPHHLESIEEHIEMCVKNASNLSYRNTDLIAIAIFHDLGKSVAKKLVEKDGITKGVYRNHANISANYYLNYQMFTDKSFTSKQADVLEAIHQHMNAHQGIGAKNMNNNNLNTNVMDLLNDFRHIDSISRVTGEGV